MPWVLWWVAWRRRWGVWKGFGLAMALLVGISFLLVPTWLGDFLEALRYYDVVSATDYHSLTWVMVRYFLRLGPVVEAVGVAAFALYGLLEAWRGRRAGWCGFLWTTGLLLILTHFIAPRTATTHYTMLLLPLFSWFALLGKRLGWRAGLVVVGIEVALLWRLAAWCFDRRTGLAVGLLAAVNPFHMAYSQEARMYALLGLAAVTAAYGLLRALENSRSREVIRHSPFIVHWSLFIVGSALTLYAHNLGAFVLLALNLLTVARRRWWRCLPALALADLAVLALFGPWLVRVLPGQVGFVERGYWLAPPGMEEVIRVLMLPVLTFYEPAPLWLLGLGLFTGLLLLVLLAWRAWRTRSRAGWFLLLCWVPVLLLLLISQWRPVYLERALLSSALLYLVAMGWLLTRGGLPRPLCLGLAVLLAASTVGSLGVHYTYTGFPRPPFQEAVAYLLDHVGSAGIVVHTNKLTYLPMRYYAPDLPGVFLADPPGSPQDTLARPTQEALSFFATSTITEAVGQAGQVWLVCFPREVEEVQALGAQHPALVWLKDRYRETDLCSFSDLDILVFEREGQ